ncbi:MAG TPA: aromatic amino acid ammonia-lyase [Actinomycetes bacterium]|nr:aromatic amino acid ammonia-lyase [Actinomycetes bacterium]
MCSDLVINGAPLAPADLAAVARGQRSVRADDAVPARMTAAREAVLTVAAAQEVYGRTTGVGANLAVHVESSTDDPLAHDRRLLASHATTGGPAYPDEVARAAMVVRANQLARGMSGASPAGYLGLVAAVRAGAVPLVHRWGGVGTGDLGALAELARALVGDVPWRSAGSPAVGPVVLAPGDVLALLSSNAVTIAQAALAAADLAELLAATEAVAALTLVASAGNLEAFDPAVHAARPHPGAVRAAASVSALLAGARITPRRVQDRFGLRAFPAVHGAALDALTGLEAVLAVETAAGAENPLVVADPAPRVLHHGSWHEAPLALALDHLRLAVVGTATLATRRLSLLLDSAEHGLLDRGEGGGGEGEGEGLAFLAAEPDGNGAMGLDYVAAAALAHLRALAGPVSLGSAVLSLGAEDHASFAPEAARLTAESVDPLRTVLAAELVATVRALRLRRLDPAELGPAPVAGALRTSYDVLPHLAADRPLTEDVTLATSLLPGLAAVVQTLGVTDE